MADSAVVAQMSAPVVVVEVFWDGPTRHDGVGCGGGRHEPVSMLR